MISDTEPLFKQTLRIRVKLLIVVLPLFENLALMEWISPGKDFVFMKGFAKQVVVTVVDTASMFETEVHDLLAQVGRSVPHCI